MNLDEFSKIEITISRPVNPERYIGVFSKIIFHLFSEATPGSVLSKKVFLEISQNSQKNTCARVSFLIKLLALGLQRYQKGDSGTGVFL